MIKKPLFFCFLVVSLLFVFLHSCAIRPTPKITGLLYEGKDYKDVDYFEIKRTKEITVQALNVNGSTYIWKIDDITLVNQQGKDKFKFKDYENHNELKNKLNEAFFKANHQLTISVVSSDKSASITKQIKIINEAPEITISPDKIDPDTPEVNIKITDPENDDIAVSNTQVIDMDGKVLWTSGETEVNLNIQSLNLSPDVYVLRVYAKDQYGAEKKAERYLRYPNKPPSVFILQPYNNEKTPISITARWKGQDADKDDILRYKAVLKSGTTEIFSVETTSTELILPNLNYNSTYTLQLTVYDLQSASSTAQVTFRTVPSPRYSHILSKSFDGKSVISIANSYNLPTIKIEGFVANVDDVQFADFDVAEDYIYAVGGRFLYVVNASDKSNPKIVKKVDLEKTLTAIKIYKNYAIVGEGSNGIRIVDLTNPSNPILTSKNFGRTIKAFTLPFKTVSTKNSKMTNSKIDITQGKIMSIKLAANNAYIANNIGGLLRLNLNNVPNITINDITLIYDEQVNDIDIGQFNNEQIIALAVGKNVKYIRLSDAENATGELSGSSLIVPSNDLFDTEIKGVRIYNNSLYAFTFDRIRKWTNDTNWNNVEYEPGSQFSDLLFVDENSIVLDGGKGLITYRNDSRYEPNKMYKISDLNYLNKFMFAVGDGFYCNGLYVLDLRDTLEPAIRQYSTGQYLNRIDVKMKAVPKGNPERIAKIVTANTDSLYAKVYDFDYTNLTLSSATPLNLSNYTKIYDVSIDAQGRSYVLGEKNNDNIIEIFNQGGSSIISTTLPATVTQLIPYFPKIYENVEPRSIQVVVDYLSESQKPSHILVACGKAGIIKYKLDVDLNGNITGIIEDTRIPTTFYVVVEEQGGGYRLQRYNPGIDSAIAVDKYFDRIFVADGDYNGIWLLDKNGINLTDKDTDNLSRTPLFSGAPARNISWFGDLLFVSGGGFGVKIVNIRDLELLDPTKSIVKIPFNGLTYAFNTEADSTIMVVGSDKGYLLYDISGFPAVRPISTLNLPMFKIIAK